MKRTIKFSAAALAAFTAIGCLNFAACKKEETEGGSKQVVLADFESFEPDFQLMRISKHFGAVNVNTDPQYVKSGNASAKIQPLGHVPSKSQPMMFFPLSSVRFEYDYSDFSYFDNVNMWVYNAEEKSAEVEIGFVERMLDINDYATVTGEKHTLKPGWNKLVYYPDLNSLNLLCDVTALLGVYLRFENTPSYDLADAPVFYVDDVQLKKLPQKQEVKELIKLDAGEILNFDKDWQQNILIVNAPNEDTRPEISIVRASEESVPLIEDGRTENFLLKVVTKSSLHTGWPWPGFEIPAKVIQKSGVTGISKAERSKYTLCFDVYAADGNKYFYPDYGLVQWASWHATNHEAKAGKWTTYRYNLTLIPSSIYGGLANIRISWPEYSEGGDMTFYFDNFRLEKAEE